MHHPSLPAPALVARLDLLVESLLDGSLVPFLGAGVSLHARPRVASAATAEASRRRQGFAPATSQLGSRLKNQLKAFAAGSSRSFSGLVDNAEHRNLAQLSELLHMAEGPYALCECLQIALFAELEPLPAHVYIACLAREGLIRQVITTNYDTCIETALERTFGGNRPIIRPDSLRKPLAVIRDLEEYRQEAGRLHTGGERRLPRLQLYKINGCARRYRERTADAMDPRERHAAAEEIILTERQLQDFGARQWARDLLRVTARSRVLLFSGFGTDEPQVRHTMLLLMEEFQRDGSGAAACLEQAHSVAELPNAPFMQVYGPTLSFNQLQPLHAFASSHLRPRPPAQLFQASEDFVQWRTATGVDGPTLHNGSRQELPADTFFMRLYQRTWQQLLKRQCADSSPFVRWLRSVPSAAAAWRRHVGGLLQWLYPQPLSPDDPTFAFGRFPGWLEHHTRRQFTAVQTLPAPLWCWLHAETLPSSKDRDAVPYPCLREDSLQILCTLFFFYLLFGDLPTVAPGTVPMMGHALPGETGSAGCFIPWWRWLEARADAPGLSLVVPSLSESDALQLQNDALGQQVRKRQAPGAVYHLVTELAPERQAFSGAPESLVYQIGIPSLGPADLRSRAMRIGAEDTRRAMEVRRVPLESVVEALLQQQEVRQDPTSAAGELVQRLRMRLEGVRQVFAQVRPTRHPRLRKYRQPPAAQGSTAS